jgi:uncharacterized SAM-binding protein YcdF (DUF218 family)
LSAVRHGALVLAEVLAVGGWLGLAVVWPPLDPPRRADAVVLLSGDGARLPVALRLMRRGVAPTLVHVGQADTREVAEVCARPQPFEVVCLRPSPDSTRDEARATARLARTRGWSTMTVVTSRFHAVRARMLFQRCFDGSVEAAGEYPSYGWEFARRAIVHEWLALAHTSVLARGC